MATLTASLLAASLSFMPLKMVIIAMMEKKKKNFLCTTVSRKFSHWSTFGKISGLDGISDILYTSVDCDIHRILACLGQLLKFLPLILINIILKRCYQRGIFGLNIFYIKAQNTKTCLACHEYHTQAMNTDNKSINYAQKTHRTCPILSVPYGKKKIFHRQEVVLCCHGSNTDRLFDGPELNIEHKRTPNFPTQFYRQKPSTTCETLKKRKMN